MTEDKQRIELHCHSKAGGRATMYPGEIMRYLSEEGMPAFAITDESNIGAFPELEMVWKTGEYTARPIYGMELMVAGMQGDVDHLSVLIKNEQGKRALYRWISENDSVEPYPLFDLGDLVERREGLLLGSGNEKGRLYKAALRGASAAELRDVISLYDYVEVLPGKPFEAINKTIIGVCEALGIPVVAISDARYADRLGRKAWKMMQHWQKEEEDAVDKFFWSTEEMLEAFSYLPEEKAYEIVVENTHRIAELCETVMVCPQETCYPVVPDAGKRLKEKCYAALQEKYAGEEEAAEERLAWELAALAQTGMESYVLQLHELLNKAGLKAEDISLRGTAAGSMVAYLLDISNIDPLVYGLTPEMVFGLHGQREIDIDINIPTGRQRDVIRRMAEVEGVGHYAWAGTVCSITDSLAQAMIERYLTDTGSYYEDAILQKLRWCITGNYQGRGKHPGGIVVFPTGCTYNEMIPTARLAGDFEITYFDYHSIDRAFIKYDLLCHDSPEMLDKLAKRTGVALQTVPIESAEVLALFEADADGKVAGCAELPEFSSEYVRNMVAVLKPKSFLDLVKISALSHGTGAWADNGELLVAEEGLGIRDIIATRDDVFDCNLAYGLDRATAYEIAEAVRKGIVSRGKNAKWQGWKKVLLEAGAPAWYIWTCEQIRYLFPRSHAISYVMMNMKLGWFLVHYPDEFHAVMQEYDEFV